MGKKNYLIEGVSGAGKTTVATELQRRGYQAIHGDRELKYRGDRVTGLEIIPETKTPSALWLSEHLLWNLDKVKAYIADKNEDFTFFCGGSRNFSKFIDLLDGVFILDVDQDTMMKRIAERVAADQADFGATEEERELILQLFATKQDIPKSGIVIDATQPVGAVVDEILKNILTAKAEHKSGF